MRSLKNQVVVITGASSGAGRAMAQEFSREGARVVLAARNRVSLERVARECRALGAEALVVRTDVTDNAQVKALARAAVRRFGRIDVWISNAGVGAIGRLNDTPIETHRHVIETNLLGPIYGAYAVLPIFEKQKHGVLLHTNSLGAFVPMPFSSAYSASKFGLRGFVEALQAELSSTPGIHIGELFPAFIRTPAIHHAANYVGRHVANPPVNASPVRVARRMVKLAKRPRGRKMMMLSTPFGRAMYFLFPALVRWGMNAAFRLYFKYARPVPRSSGNIFRASRGNSVVAA